MPDKNEADDEQRIKKMDLSRRRILQVSGVAVAAGTGVVGTAAGHGSDAECNSTISFSDQSVKQKDDGTYYVVVDADLKRDGFIDIHDAEDNCGPSDVPETLQDCFGKGYPMGATCYLTAGSYTDLVVPIWESNCSFGTCIDWGPEETSVDSGGETWSAMAHKDTDDNELFTHYCQHESATAGTDHAFVCDYDGDGNNEPLLDQATITPP